MAAFSGSTRPTVAGGLGYAERIITKQADQRRFLSRRGGSIKYQVIVREQRRRTLSRYPPVAGQRRSWPNGLYRSALTQSILTNPFERFLPPERPAAHCSGSRGAVAQTKPSTATPTTPKRDNITAIWSINDLTHMIPTVTLNSSDIFS